jgi:hypothetical protein
LLLFNESRQDPFMFGAPGRYRLRAHTPFDDESGEIPKILKSEDVEIFVKPIPQAERKPLELFQNMPLARGVQGWDQSEKSAQQAAELIATYPSSMYADHARYFLGSYWRHKLSAAGPADAAEKSYAVLDTVSPRLGALRLRALIRMAEVAQYRVPDGRKSPEYARIVAELEAYMPLAEAIGLEKEIADILERAEGARHPQGQATVKDDSRLRLRQRARRRARRSRVRCVSE